MTDEQYQVDNIPKALSSSNEIVQHFRKTASCMWLSQEKNFIAWNEKHKRDIYNLKSHQQRGVKRMGRENDAVYHQYFLVLEEA